MRAARALTVNVPKPTSEIDPPPANVWVTLSSTASTALVASARDIPAFVATDSISSPLFMHSPLQIYNRNLNAERQYFSRISVNVQNIGTPATLGFCRQESLHLANTASGLTYSQLNHA
jgi:hypothetical protein